MNEGASVEIVADVFAILEEELIFRLRLKKGRPVDVVLYANLGTDNAGLVDVVAINGTDVRFSDGPKISKNKDMVDAEPRQSGVVAVTPDVGDVE